MATSRPGRMLGSGDSATTVPAPTLHPVAQGHTARCAPKWEDSTHHHGTMRCPAHLTEPCPGARPAACCGHPDGRPSTARGLLAPLWRSGARQSCCCTLVVSSFLPRAVLCFSRTRRPCARRLWRRAGRHVASVGLFVVRSSLRRVAVTQPFGRTFGPTVVVAKLASPYSPPPAARMLSGSACARVCVRACACACARACVCTSVSVR